MRLVRWSAAVAGAMIIVAATVVAGAGWITLPAGSERVDIAGLSAPVHVSFDQDGVPRITAANSIDAAAALGYVHARDRALQMDLMRRAASGRLAEWVGPAGLRLDRYMRTLGLRERAVADLASLPPLPRALLEAYARGVNARFRERGRTLAPEFLVLGAPEPWSPVDSLLWGKTEAMYLAGNARTELARAALASKLPVASILQLWPAPAWLPDSHASIDNRPGSREVKFATALLPRFPERFTLPGTASNEWAVDGRLTTTGAPLLAGDPHLGFSFPSIWYLARIETPSAVLVGATAPGLPFLLLGHNGSIAWSFTTTGADTEDIFEEQEVDRDHYLGPDGPLAYDVRDEVIHVRGAPDEHLRVRNTRHGPVISDLRRPGDPQPAAGVVLAMAAASLLRGDTSALGIMALNDAHDIAAAGRAAALISAPVQNLLVADHDKIALYTTGCIPVRGAGDGTMPAPGQDHAYDWVGLVSGEQLPHIVAPPSGRIVNANEPVMPGTSSVFLGRDMNGGWRASRISDMLAKSDRLTVDDFVRMQADVRSDYAARLLPVLLKVPAQGAAADALGLLRDWDGTMSADLAEPLIFNAWLQRFEDSVLARNALVPSSASPRLEFTAWLLTSGDAAAGAWCGGDCQTILQETLISAVAALSRAQGADPASWRWGRAHQAVFANALLQDLPIVGRLTTGRVPAPGDASTVNAAATASDSFDAVHGPSYRGVYDLADLSRSRFSIAPGQSGNPFSHHAWDFLHRWRDGGTITLGPTPSVVEQVLQLSPTSPP
jgi:penicillin amidase